MEAQNYPKSDNIDDAPKKIIEKKAYNLYTKNRYLFQSNNEFLSQADK